MPFFTFSELPLIGKSASLEIVKEFFYYSKSLKEEFIIHIREDFHLKNVHFDVYRSNGQYVNTTTKNIPKMAKTSVASVIDDTLDMSFLKVSPNGRFMYYTVLEECEGKLFTQ